MKALLSILSMLLCYLVSAQEQPVVFEGKINKNAQGQWHVEVMVQLKEGWHVYAVADAGTGIEPLTIDFQSPGIDVLKVVDPPAVSKINDPVFNAPLDVYKSDFLIKQEVRFTKQVPAELSLKISGFASNTEEFIPIEKIIKLYPEGGVKVASGKLPNVDLNNPVNNCGTKSESGKGLFAIFMLGIAGGLLALLTPCVFPMIPVTVSYFSHRKGSATRQGILYGGLILLIYLLASIPFHIAGNISPEIFNTISTNAWVNVFFFIVFVLFALSFFGLFEIRLPAYLANNTGNRGGIFFMALTLAIVSFSCTGPILGTLLVGAISSNGSAWELTTGMAGFGVALGCPFALFAIFPSWLKRLPKSGGWMEVVKKSLAFVELALAVKFLSNADLVEHWGLLKREVFIGLWILIALGLAFYLLGAFDKKQVFQPSNVLWVAGSKPVRNKVAPIRFVFGVLTIVFALYLTPGITQSSFSNLSLLSGFPPPLSYSVYGKENIRGKGLEPDVINDYEKAVAISKQTNKPILIDFTGWGCVNCRKMEEQVWTKPEVKSLIEEKFILLSLYVDDRETLADGTTVGKKWAKFQAENFGQVTQPLYVVLSPDERLMSHPVGYTPDVNEYVQWLTCGLAIKN